MIPLLIFGSGFAALAYQVLWLRDLGLVFGATAQAAAVDVAVFFAGLALGAALFGRVAARVTNPLRVYGFLELGIGVSALLVFSLLDTYRGLVLPLSQTLGGSAPLLAAMKTALAAVILGPPTVLMGGTLPVLAQHLVSQPETLGRQGAMMYAVNTAGATAGAFVAGFFLPAWLGYRASYLATIGLNVAIGLGALVLAQRPARSALAAANPKPPARASRAATAPRPGVVPVLVLALLSGVLTLSLEIAWVRMFAQVLDNSIYAFSAILVVFLIALAAGSFVASRLAASTADPGRVLGLLFIAGSIAIGWQPSLFVAMTGGLTQVTSSGDWASYVLAIFRLTAAVIFVPGVIVGAVFPYLLRAARWTQPPGSTLGRLTYVNLLGAIAGSLATSFVAIPFLGLWRTCQVIAITYGLLALATGARAAIRVVAVVVSIAAFLIIDPARLPLVHLDSARAERVLQTWEGASGVVAVTDTSDGRVLRMNNSYLLGGTVDRVERERLQTFVPLLIHPRPGSVFFLGLGTGITAGEAVRHPVAQVVVSELVPEVVEASRIYFNDWTRGLAADPRVEIRIEDGRHLLSVSDASFDVIISDLFVPWHAGTGTLYTREHFQTVRTRLKPGGLFAQWLPLYQLNERDVKTIARTLMEVFPHVALWRGDFYANRPIVALVASVTPVPLDPDRLRGRARALAPGVDEALVLPALLPYYVGNLSAAPAVLGPGEVNTDDRPVIEYQTPRTQWRHGRAGDLPWFVSSSLVRFFDDLQSAVPVERDPNLSSFTPEERGYVLAGAQYYRAIVLRVAGDDAAAERALADALQRLPESLKVAGPFMAIEPLLR